MPPSNMVELTHRRRAEGSPGCPGVAKPSSAPCPPESRTALPTAPCRMPSMSPREDQPVNLCGAFESGGARALKAMPTLEDGAETIRAAGVCLLMRMPRPHKFAVGIRARECEAGPGHAPEPDAHRAGTCRRQLLLNFRGHREERRLPPGPRPSSPPPGQAGAAGAAGGLRNEIRHWRAGVGAALASWRRRKFQRRLLRLLVGEHQQYVTERST